MTSSKSAKSAPSAEGRKTDKFDATFVNYDLSKQQKEQCRAMWTEPAELVELLDRLVESGYSVSAKFDEYNQCYACFVRESASGGDNAGLILTGRGSTASKAIKQAMYKHWIVFKLEWPRVKRSSIDEVWDD